VTFASARAEREYWLAREAALRFEQKAGVLIPLWAAEQVYGNAVVLARVAFEDLPLRLAPRLAGMTDLTQIRRILADEIHAILLRLTETDVTKEVRP